MLVYPLVNVDITNWKDPPFSMGKSTISTGSFSIATLNYQRVSQKWSVEGTQEPLIPLKSILASNFKDILLKLFR